MRLEPRVEKNLVKVFWIIFVIPNEQYLKNTFKKLLKFKKKCTIYIKWSEIVIKIYDEITRKGPKKT